MSAIRYEAQDHIALITLRTNPMSVFYPMRDRLEGILRSDDLQEGVRAIGEKRKPRFKGT